MLTGWKGKIGIALIDAVCGPGAPICAVALLLGAGFFWGSLHRRPPMCSMMSWKNLRSGLLIELAMAQGSGTGCVLRGGDGCSFSNSFIYFSSGGSRPAACLHGNL